MARGWRWGRAPCSGVCSSRGCVLSGDLVLAFLHLANHPKAMSLALILAAMLVVSSCLLKAPLSMLWRQSCSHTCNECSSLLQIQITESLIIVSFTVDGSPGSTPLPEPTLGSRASNVLAPAVGSY
ncbi:hypothetical protein EJB05_22640 [Eragrostis curvula]|uniref:Uncharacterized protein n=1 Tax=Eragrostis curvula TaxID=38414 RepID=A0A5J9V4Y2_9POAL|nr:hypothetical protein EJB05_22634 [Eragrostis curvula]TVU30980.1 hypothetical protein EJB05_22640 [Eragrostis curvula]